MNKAQYKLLLPVFWLLLIDLVRTQQEDVRRGGAGFVQFNDEDNFMSQVGRKGQQQGAKLKQTLQQMLKSSISKIAKQTDEDYTPEYEDTDDDYDNDDDMEPDVGTETGADDDADEDTDTENNADYENESENDSNSNGATDADENTGSTAGTDGNSGSSPGSDSSIDDNPESDSNSGSNTGSDAGTNDDDDIFSDDDFEYDPYTNSFNEQEQDGTYVFGYALPHGVRRYERAFYSDKNKGLTVEGFSVEPRLREERLVYELRCYRSDAYGYRPLKVEYLNRPPAVQRDVEPNVDCFN